MTMPPSVCGSTTLRVVRHFAAPSARLASRRESGTSSTSWVVRATSGSIRTREREARLPGGLAVADNKEDEHEDAEHDRRDSVEDVERERELFATRLGASSFR